uniref:Uncharacterized protein n=1 Tax=Setaria italica TaxID=4555 RepID=K3YMJ2_SETIT
MASAAAVKIAAIFMLVLTMGHLMAEASPQPRRLLAETEHAAVSGNPGLPVSPLACKPECTVPWPPFVCIC